MILGTGKTLSLTDTSWLFEELTCEYQNENLPRLLAGTKLEKLERQAIFATLEKTDGNRTEAARALGISDRTLRDKIKRYRNRESILPTG